MIGTGIHLMHKIIKGWTKTTFHNFETWLWIISNPYNINVSEYLFDRMGSIDPEQTFGHGEYGED